MPFVIRIGSIEEVLQIYSEIPEFQEPYGAGELARRFSESPQHLILVAYDDDKPIGFKAGYQRDDNGSFYSWMGGVAKDYRRHGIAQALLDEMANWCQVHGYKKLWFKTLNRHKSMLQFGLRNHFDIIGFEPQEPNSESRIWLEKYLF